MCNHLERKKSVVLKSMKKDDMTCTVLGECLKITDGSSYVIQL